MTERLFKSIELLKVYKTGGMDEFLKLHRKHISESNLISIGGDATVFNYDGDTVLKVCSKDIRYFDNFSQSASAQDFAAHINQMTPYFLPIKKILYENNEMIAYVQPTCQILDKSNIDKNVLLDVFEFVRFMLKNNCIVTDLAPHNWGIYNGKATVFDYHGLHLLKRPDRGIRKADWWHRIARNLTRFITAVYTPDKRKGYATLMQSCDSFALAELKKESRIPKSFYDLLEYFYVKQNNVSISETCAKLEACIDDIINTKVDNNLKQYRPSSKDIGRAKMLDIIKEKNKDKSKAPSREPNREPIKEPSKEQRKEESKKKR